MVFNLLSRRHFSTFPDHFTSSMWESRNSLRIHPSWVPGPTRNFASCPRAQDSVEGISCEKSPVKRTHLASLQICHQLSLARWYPIRVRLGARFGRHDALLTKVKSRCLEDGSISPPLHRTLFQVRKLLCMCWASHLNALHLVILRFLFHFR